jgi:hypothetical protein
MRRTFIMTLALELLWGAAGPDASAAQIRAAKIAAPAGLTSGGSVDIPLDRYWRGNVLVGPDGLTDNQKQFPHQPTLLEYRVELPVGGQFELQARYTAAKPSPAYLTLDGEALGKVFEQPADHQGEWSTLGSTRLRPGEHRIRLTSQYVDTPFPKVHALRLVFHGGEVPPPMPEPKVVGYRAELPKDWYKSISRKIHGDFHTAGFIRGVGKSFNGDEYAGTLERAGVNSICVFAKGHHGYAYFNTKVGTRHPGLEFDLMGEQIKACHARNIAVWIYYSIGIDELYSSTQQEPDGRPNANVGKIKVATDTHYVKDYLWPMITESVRDYDIDGVFFDFPGDEAFVQQTIKLIKGIKPGVVVAYNHQWEKTREELKKLDVLEIESWRHKQTLYHWQYVARYARGAVPMTAMTIRFWKGWGDFGGIADEAMLRYEVATGLANGCAITIGDHLHPFGRLDPAVYERIGRVFHEAMKVEPYVTDSESIPYVALLRQNEITCTAMIDAGIHFSVIDTTQDLAPFAAVVVPDGSKIDAAYTAKLEQYVRRGGRILVTGKPTPELARLLGVRIAADAEPSYIRVDAKVLPTPPATNLYTYEKVVVADAADTTQTLAPLVWPLNHGTTHESRRQSPPFDVVSGHAAVTLRKLDRGQAAYVAAPLFDIYAAWGYTPMRQILSDVLQTMIPPAERLAQVESPAPLEVSLNRQSGRVIIHLVHCPQSRRTASSFREKGGEEDFVNREPMIDGVPTIRGAKLHLAESLVKGRKLRLLQTGAPLDVRDDKAGVLTVAVPDFEISAVLVAE